MSRRNYRIRRQTWLQQSYAQKGSTRRQMCRRPRMITMNLTPRSGILLTSKQILLNKPWMGVVSAATSQCKSMMGSQQANLQRIKQQGASVKKVQPLQSWIQKAKQPGLQNQTLKAVVLQRMQVQKSKYVLLVMSHQGRQRMGRAWRLRERRIEFRSRTTMWKQACRERQRMPALRTPKRMMLQALLWRRQQLPQSSTLGMPSGSSARQVGRGTAPSSRRRSRRSKSITKVSLLVTMSGWTQQEIASWAGFLRMISANWRLMWPRT
mmetsp:Transcript_26482/g.61769  ORF Transcript_26482/g.61769 Transcript_26482/m.61769 type:complete len:266 (-) Transcript_26482:2290-3087(-)